MTTVTSFKTFWRMDGFVGACATCKLALYSLRGPVLIKVSSDTMYCTKFGIQIVCELMPAGFLFNLGYGRMRPMYTFFSSVLSHST